MIRQRRRNMAWQAAVARSQGAYGLYHEAYRRAAEAVSQRNPDQPALLPRQMQSIAWEAVRGLFSDVQKRDGAFVEGNSDLWNAFRNGRANAADTRRAIIDHAGGINPPTWYVPPPVQEAP